MGLHTRRSGDCSGDVICRAVRPQKWWRGLEMGAATAEGGGPDDFPDWLLVTFEGITRKVWTTDVN